MALALNDFSGAETGGLEETSATVGTPSAPTTNPRSGARAYRLAAGDAIEFVGIREYRQGDPIRSIHWRSWARRGEPIVKEYQDVGSGASKRRPDFQQMLRDIQDGAFDVFVCWKSDPPFPRPLPCCRPQ